jgi:type VI secretion system protein VasD
MSRKLYFIFRLVKLCFAVIKGRSVLRPYKFLIFYTVLLAGCSGAPLHVKLNSTSYLNPDEQNRSLPVEIVIYQLRDDQEFKQATFQELWQRDRETLGSSMLSRREMNVPPRSRTKISLRRNKEAVYIGAIAIFRNPRSGHWRDIKKLGRELPLVSKTINIVVSGNRLRM